MSQGGDLPVGSASIDDVLVQTTIEIKKKKYDLIILKGCLGSGGSAAVYRARLVCRERKRSVGHVAVKVVVLLDEKSQKLFDREVERWSEVDHRYAQPFYGVSERFGTHLYGIASPIAEQGNLIQFINNNPEFNRLQLLVWIAEGLQYFHLDKKIVHGDLKCANILMTGGRPKISDFGLSTLIERIDPLTTATSVRNRNTVAFAAPELLRDDAYQNATLRALVAFVTSPKKRSKTTHSDVFAFGRLIYEVYAAQEPWSNIRSAHTIRDMVLLGEIPPRKVTNAHAMQLDEALWQFCQRCWDENPNRRPDCIDIMDTLTYVFNSHIPARQKTTGWTPYGDKRPASVRARYE